MTDKRVLLTTVFTGYNYGSSLQAFAGKTFLNNLGLECSLIAQRSLVKGHNIQLKKLLTIVFRSLLVSKQGAATFKKQYEKKFVGNSKQLFELFEKEFLRPNYCSWSELKNVANGCLACFAGSDQIWNSTALYVDPLYYLRFAPKSKRVAFAPSFGRDFVADYNQKKMSKWIADIPHLSVREDSGVELIKQLTGKNAIQLIDPTLMIDGSQWTAELCLKQYSDNYILAYFLDEPSDIARRAIKTLSEKIKCKVIAIPHQFDDMSYCNMTEVAGPKEFLELVKGAKIVCTDSFHGTAFSINFHTPFYVFERSYGSAQKQSSRILSILRKMNLMDRYEKYAKIENWNTIDFSYSDKVLKVEREKCKQYVLNAIK